MGQGDECAGVPVQTLCLNLGRHYLTGTNVCCQSLDLFLRHAKFTKAVA